jgi:hypothetical protein
MPNHLHIIWKIQDEWSLEGVQRDFLKFTAKELLSLMKKSCGNQRLERALCWAERQNI